MYLLSPSQCSTVFYWLVTSSRGECWWTRCCPSPSRMLCYTGRHPLVESVGGSAPLHQRAFPFVARSFQDNINELVSVCIWIPTLLKSWRQLFRCSVKCIQFYSNVSVNTTAFKTVLVSQDRWVARTILWNLLPTSCSYSSHLLGHQIRSRGICGQSYIFKNTVSWLVETRRIQFWISLDAVTLKCGCQHRPLGRSGSHLRVSQSLERLNSGETITKW